MVLAAWKETSDCVVSDGGWTAVGSARGWREPANSEWLRAVELRRLLSVGWMRAAVADVGGGRGWGFVG